jgi:SAM-dependent methyltransferase
MRINEKGLVMAVDALQEIVSRLNASAGALAALGAALDARASGAPLEPEIRPHVEDVLVALGARDALADVEPSDLQPLLGEIRAFALTNIKLLFATARRSGWAHSEPEILQAAGDVSVAFPRVLKRSIAPNLQGLAERLESPGASFLDSGVGVAALSIEMARLWPSLHVVGIDQWAPALALARDRVRAAGLATRIELREQAGEELSDTDAFDLAWIPGAFVSEEASRALVQRIFRALRPGGWLLFAMVRSRHDPLTDALTRLRTSLFGGFVTTNENVEALLRQHGFIDVRTLPSRPTSLTAMVAARRSSVS